MKTNILSIGELGKNEGFAIRLNPETAQEEKLLSLTFYTYARNPIKMIPVFHETRNGNITDSLTINLYNSESQNNQSPTRQELFDLIKEMHSHALYQISSLDDRPTHLPHWLYDKVENILNSEK